MADSSQRRLKVIGGEFRQRRCGKGGWPGSAVLINTSPVGDVAGGISLARSAHHRESRDLPAISRIIDSTHRGSSDDTTREVRDPPWGFMGLLRGLLIVFSCFRWRELIHRALESIAKDTGACRRKMFDSKRNSK